jgi:hypothetical protein
MTIVNWAVAEAFKVVVRTALAANEMITGSLYALPCAEATAAIAPAAARGSEQ